MTWREFALNVAGAVVVVAGLWAFCVLLFTIVPGPQ